MNGTYLALFAMLPMSLVGFFINWFVFRTLLRLKSFRMAFGYLSASQSFADAIHSTTHLFFFFPLILTNHPFLASHATHLGFSILACYELSLYTHLAISINRFCAVWMPQSYSKIFSNTNTLIIIAVIWIVLLTSNSIQYEYLCAFVYVEIKHSILFDNTPVCGLIGFFAVLLKNAFFILILIIVDVFTLIGVKKTRTTTHMSSATQDRISNREKRFLKQIIYQSIIIVLELSAYFVVPQLSDDPDVFFFATTFAFVTVHVVDGTHPFLVKHAHLLGLSIMTCYELSLYTHLAISINRFCAVWIPQSYSKVFSIKNTIVIIVVIWIVLIASNLTYYEYLCEIVYYEPMHSIGFGQTETCTYVGLFAVLLKNLFFIFILIIVDVFTLIGVKKTRATTHMSSTTQDRISNREKRFIKQIIYQGIIIVIELTVYFIIPQLSKDPDVFFFSTTFTYVTVHAIDGVCMVIIYPDIRASLFCHKKVIQASSVNKSGP